MNNKLPIIYFFLTVSAFICNAQTIKPGFNGAEYKELLEIVGKLRDSMPDVSTSKYKLVYRSPRMGFKNCYEAWEGNNNTGVIHIQGTIADAVSWLANFYCPMIKAQGQLQINDSTVFDYKLADNASAYVHTGWLTSLAHMAPGILTQINAMQAKGINQIYLLGHSQGGAITFLLTSYLRHLQLDGKLDKNIVFKSYCSAAPKPGNLYFAYDFDFITRNGYAYRVVNTEDWVPEAPFSLQTVNDFNSANPFVNAKKSIKQQKFLTRIYLNSVYNKLNGSTTKAMKTFRKQLGKKLFKVVKKNLPQYKEPQYVYSQNYTPAGVAIVLMADNDYKSKFVFDGKNVFVHHLLKPYVDLLDKQYSK